MSDYDNLLNLARTKAKAFQTTAKEFIPNMYAALLKENQNISPIDARDRIQKDCVDIWSRRTILDALPDEAKDKEKQKAGRLSQKEQNSAAFSAATALEETKKIVVDTQGRPIEEENLESTADSSIMNTGDILAPSQEKLNKQIKPDSECPSCQELNVEISELRETVKKLTVLKTADDILASSTSPIKENPLDAVGFEFPLQFGDVRSYMLAAHSKMGDGGKIWFSGKIDKKTGRVISAKTGKIEPQKSEINDGDDV